MEVDEIFFLNTRRDITSLSRMEIISEINALFLQASFAFYLDFNS